LVCGLADRGPEIPILRKKHRPAKKSPGGVCHAGFSADSA
jgi:hypothetical protein